HIFVHLERDGDSYEAIVPIPSLFDRIQLIEIDGKRSIFFTEDIVRHNVKVLFKGYEVTHSFVFRITRNADLELQEEGADDLLSVIEDYIERRKNGMAVRLEIDHRSAKCDIADDVSYLRDELELKERDVYHMDGPLDLTYLLDLIDELEETYPELVNKP